MSPINIKLTQSLQTGFINQNVSSYKEYLPQLLVNDKTEGKKILSTIINELNNCEEFWFSVAFITTSGVATLVETLITLEKKGIKGKILVSQYLNFTQPEALKKILQFKNIELKIAVDNAFHSKGYLFKKKDIYNLIIGSSNLTASALCTNIEWNLKITATPISHIIFNAIKEFTTEYEKALSVDIAFIDNYEILYKKQIDYTKSLKKKLFISNIKEITPNLMQEEALANIEQLRIQGKTKALLISATGTGKTYLSAFDVKKVNPKKFLFIVHRLNIAKAAKKGYETIFGNSKSMGIYSGNHKELDADFIFSTIQTISRDSHLKQFNPNHFEYIVIDETHRASAESYQKILNYFNPKFLLGMTATPERTDGLDVFKLFDYNIAYEIRLHRALEEKMLSPFHYYGVTDITVDGKILDEDFNFNFLVSEERIDRIIEKANIYGCDNDKVRGLIFCSSNNECLALSNGFNQRGYKTIALSGDSSEEQRAQSIKNLESNEKENQLDYIFTVDIFNEGIDIPSVNQIIMIRPTQSAIVFIQQLGRGLRKIDNKGYLTVIDFIGNYKNNFLIPIALYGDTTYNKDSIRKLISSGSDLIPGTSTINFDQISKERIFESINSANMTLKRDLVKDYTLLKFQLGRIPMMIDFLEHGSRDPFLYVKYSKSYLNFVIELEDNLELHIDIREKKLLELFSNEINNSKRIEESLILKHLIHSKKIDIENFKSQIKKEYGYLISDETIDSSLNNLNFKFITENKDKKLVTVNKIYGFSILEKVGDKIIINESFSKTLNNSIFFQFLEDNIDYSIKTFNKLFKKNKFINGFVLYRKYSRKDVFRILNWESNPLAQNVGGYLINSDKTNCPIFVNYHKEESISSTTKYEDRFISNSEFEWMSKSKRTLNSPDVKSILNHKSELRLPLFIKKNNDEGTEFYFMGDMKPTENGFVQTSIPDDNGKLVSVVKINFTMNHPVEDSIYEYLTNGKDIELNSKEIIEPIPVVEINLSPFRVLPFDEINQYVNCIPLYDIKAAAGNFSDLQINEETEWIELSKPFKYNSDYFVCKVIGESMNKIIPSNSWCLFKKDTGGSRNGKIVLVHQSNIQDSDFGRGFTVKSYESKKSITEEIWSHNSIILKPQSYNPTFKSIVLVDDDDLIDLKVIGLFVEILN
ncbi:DEAD/DEAH box helicase [Flavobacterium sp. Sr18]|uniref:DEAD/DEAH box helicase n=1 Tax=Flavobacterium sp. Sr18 TaxID=935222 RepID=UPI0013E45582|nr:DEAD/DEAH box helicase [Flavobacterium sp. Sr18]QIH39178.1 DEAD/DEAH box helicase [Flavobacterium sp. Sr18]